CHGGDLPLLHAAAGREHHLPGSAAARDPRAGRELEARARPGALARETDLRLLQLALIVLLGLGAAGCGARTPGSSAPANVLLIVLDTTRADRLSRPGD